MINWQIILAFLSQIKNMKEVFKMFQNGNFKKFFKSVPAIFIVLFIVFVYYFSIRPFMREQFGFYSKIKSLEQIDTIKNAIVDIKKQMMTKEDFDVYKKEQQKVLAEALLIVSMKLNRQLQDIMDINNADKKVIRKLERDAEDLKEEMRRLKEFGYIELKEEYNFVNNLGLTDSVLSLMINNKLILKQLR